MIICTARLPRKRDAILREFMRLNRQDFMRGIAYGFRPTRGGAFKPRSHYILPIVPLDVPKLDGYGSRYRPLESRPMSSTPLDLV